MFSPESSTMETVTVMGHEASMQRSGLGHLRAAECMIRRRIGDVAPRSAGRTREWSLGASFGAAA
jgi:hypothetical protein